MIALHHNYFVFFGGSNNIFADCSTSAAVRNPQHIEDSSGVDMLEAVKAECLEDGEDSGRENIFFVILCHLNKRNSTLDKNKGKMVSRLA